MNIVTEKSSVGAFYLHKKTQEDLLANPEDEKSIKEQISGALDNIKEQITDFDPKEFAKNFALNCPSKFVMKYSTAIMVNISNGRAIKSDAILDILFVDLAPLMGLTQAFLGYTSIDSMRHAIKNNSGNFNITGFIRGMNYGLQTLQNEKKIKNFEQQYEDIIPIDLIESCQFGYKDSISVHKLKNAAGEDYIARPGAKDVEITLVGHINNKQGNFTQSNDYIHKLESCMALDKWTNSSNKDSNELSGAGTITLRIGNDIYEKCILSDLSADVSVKDGGVYDMKITAKLLYDYYELEKSKKESTMTSGLNIVNQNPYL